MKGKALTLSAVCFAFFFGSTCAATVFRISVEGQADVLTTTAPVERGSVVLVRRLSDGRLTAIPSELVRAVSAVPKGSIAPTSIGAGKLTSRLAITKAATTLGSDRTTLVSAKTSAGMTTTKAAATLASGSGAAGTTIFLGPTGGSARTTALDTLVISAARAGATTTTSSSGLGTSIEAQIFRGDLPRLTPTGTALTLATPATTAATSPLTEIGPNGFPVFANETVPALATVGPNGFLTSAVPATATATPPIAPNGFPDTSATASAQTGLTPGAQAATLVVPSTSSAATTATTAAGNAGGVSTMAAPAPSVGAPAAGTAAMASPR